MWFKGVARAVAVMRIGRDRLSRRTWAGERNSSHLDRAPAQVGDAAARTRSAYRFVVLAILMGSIAIWGGPAGDARAQQGAPSGVDRLIGQLRDKDADFRSAAVQTLGRLSAEEKNAAVPVLIEMLQDADHEVRKSAAEALGEIGAEAQAAVPALTEMAEGPERGLRGPAAEALESIRAGAEGQLAITFEDGRLSVRVQNNRLDSVLDEISRRAKLAVIMGDGVASQRLSAEFSDLPLDQGLRRILKHQDVFYYHRGGARLLTIWVYLKNQGRGLYPVPREEWASTAEFEKGLSHFDPAERAWAVEALLERKGELTPQNTVLRALGDEDLRVRTSALYGALNEGIKLPPDTLAKLALEDPTMKIRFLALQGLAGDPSLEWIAEQALDDPNPVIRNYAEKVLDRLDRAANPPEPSPPAQEQQGQ